MSSTTGHRSARSTKRWPPAAGQAPVSVDVDERAAAQRRQDQLARLEHVALRAVIDPVALEQGSSARASGGSISAHAASGTAAALRVPCTQHTMAPASAAAATASRASRDFPMPAGAVTTTAGQAPLVRTLAIRSSSWSRPVSGQACDAPEPTRAPATVMGPEYRPARRPERGPSALLRPPDRLVGREERTRPRPRRRLGQARWARGPSRRP